MFRPANRSELLKIILPAILAILLFTLVLFGVVIPDYQTSLLNGKKEMIRELINSSWKILETAQQLEVSGALSREEAQRRAIEQVGALRYGDEGKDYFWLNDMRSLMLMHPYRPDLVGKNLADFTDANGKPLIKAFVNEVRQHGAGYVDYMWPHKDDPSVIVPKLSFVKGFAPWGWIIGTGIYLDDVDKEIAAITRKSLLISCAIVGLVAGLTASLASQALHAARRRRQAEEELLAHQSKLEAQIEDRTMALTSSNEKLVTEVNERRQAEALLRHQHDFLHTIIDSLPYPFYVVNVKDYSIELSNSKAVTMGRGHGSTCFVLFHGRPTPCDSSTDYTCPMQEVRRTGRPTLVEHIHLGPDGGKVFVEVHACPVFNEQGEVEQMIEYAIDISQRKRVEEERERLIVELREALDNIKTLRGIVPICSFCKKIRDDKGYWSQVERYVSEHSLAEFSHTYCPKCLKENYPEEAAEMERTAAPS